METDLRGLLAPLANGAGWEAEVSAGRSDAEAPSVFGRIPSETRHVWIVRV